MHNQHVAKGIVDGDELVEVPLRALTAMFVALRAMPGQDDPEERRRLGDIAFAALPFACRQRCVILAAEQLRLRANGL